MDLFSLLMKDKILFELLSVLERYTKETKGTWTWVRGKEGKMKVILVVEGP